MPTPVDPQLLRAIAARRRQNAKTAPTKGTTPITPAAPAATTTPRTPAPHKGSGRTAAALTPEQQMDLDAAAAVRSRFGGTEREIRGQHRDSGEMQGNITDWFQKYKDDVETARQRTVDFDAGVQKGLSTQTDKAEAQDTAAATTPEAQQAALSRRDTRQSFGDMLASQASAQNAYQADQWRIGGGEATDQHLKEAGRARSLRDDLEDLQGQKGDFDISYRADRKAADRKAALEDAAFGLDVTKAQSDDDAKKAAAKADAKAEANKQNKYGFTTKEWNKLPESEKKKYRDGTNKPKAPTAGYGPGGPDMNKYGYTYEEWTALDEKGKADARAGKGGKKAGPTAADKRAEVKRIGDIRDKSSKALNRLDLGKGKWQSLKGASKTTGAKDDAGHDVTNADGTPQTKPLTDADRVAELVNQGFTPNEIHLIRLLDQGRKWGPQEVAMAHQLGIRVPRSYLAYDPKTTAGSKSDPKPTTGQQNGLGGK